MNPVVADWLNQPNGLAARLRALRTQAGLSGKALAEAIGWQPSKVSRLENGRQMPTRTDLEAWATACNAGQREVRDLLDVLGEAQSVHSNRIRLMSRGPAATQAHYTQLEQESLRVRVFQVTFIPALLQIPEYARRVFAEVADLADRNYSDVDAAITARVRRQQVLYDLDKQFEFLLGEAALRWVVCPPEVMSAQLDRLQTILGLPNVRFGVIPLGAQLPVMPWNSFALFDDVAHVETIVGETIHGPKESDVYARVIDRLWGEALTGEDARQLIVRAAEDLRRSA